MRVDPYAAEADPSRRAGRLGVGVISAGRVGAVLGAALRGAGHHLVGVHAVSEDSRSRAETLLPEVPVLPVPDIVKRSDLVLLAVPDDVLGEVISGLAEAGHIREGQLIVHTSGLHGTGIAAPAQRCGAIPLAIHPAMTFTGLSVDLQRLPSCSFAVTAAAPMLPIGQALVVEMGGDPVVVAEEHRASYHAALAHASNHLNTITAQSAQLLGEIGIEHPERVLSALLQASLDNALASGEGSLTGPVARGDVETLREHIRALGDAAVPADIRPAYVAMARATALRAHERGLLGAQQLESIIGVLDD